MILSIITMGVKKMKMITMIMIISRGVKKDLVLHLHHIKVKMKNRNKL